MKYKLWENSKTQTGTKLKKSNYDFKKIKYSCDKSKNNKLQKKSNTLIVTTLKNWSRDKKKNKNKKN